MFVRLVWIFCVVSEYTVAEAAYVGRIPKEVSFSQAAPILCAGVTTYKALKETEAKAGQWVAVMGACGGLGHVGCQYAKAMGLRVVAVDFGEEKRDYALNTLKCDAFVDVKVRILLLFLVAVCIFCASDRFQSCHRTGCFDIARVVVCRASRTTRWWPQ